MPVQQKHFTAKPVGTDWTSCMLLNADINYNGSIVFILQGSWHAGGSQ